MYSLSSSYCNCHPSYHSYQTQWKYQRPYQTKCTHWKYNIIYQIVPPPSIIISNPMSPLSDAILLNRTYCINMRIMPNHAYYFIHIPPPTSLSHFFPPLLWNNPRTDCALSFFCFRSVVTPPFHSSILFRNRPRKCSFYLCFSIIFNRNTKLNIFSFLN